ncbi:MAG: hypothetical protein HFACDABA_03022 [Anaerolineales bacterium]|nr:hypothetical protein [Anaerolineales bacterium]
MKNSEFEWDDEKAESNLRKHRISFEEGATIFNDPKVATISDPDHSKQEDRYVSIGTSVMRRLLSIGHSHIPTRKNLID